VQRDNRVVQEVDRGDRVDAEEDAREGAGAAAIGRAGEVDY